MIGSPQWKTFVVMVRAERELQPDDIRRALHAVPALIAVDVTAIVATDKPPESAERA